LAGIIAAGNLKKEFILYKHEIKKEMYTEKFIKQYKIPARKSTVFCLCSFEARLCIRHDLVVFINALKN